MARFALTGLLVALLLTGCDRGATEADALEAANEAALDGASSANPDGQDVPAVALSTSGLSLTGIAGGPMLDFGTARSAVMDSLAAADLPAPEMSRNAECGAGPMEFARLGGLTLNFLNGEFVGWMAREGSDAMTADGIRPGISFAELARQRSAAMVEDSTLGGEFTYQSTEGTDIGGFVNAEGDIESLYAGTNCFFR